jgi:MFS family permease
MRSSTSRVVSAARICALNGGIQIVWSAILGLSLQSRAIALAKGVDPVTAYAWIFALGALVATVVQIAAGTLSDRMRRTRGNRLPFYTTGIALAIPAIVWFYLAPSLVQLGLAFLAVEFAMNIVCGPYQAVIPDYVAAARRGLASSWMSAYQSLGGALGLIVAGVLHDLRFVALAIVAPLAGSFAVTAGYLRGIPSQAAVEIDPGPAATRVELRGPLGALLLSRGLINVGFYTLLGFLLFFVRDSLHVGGDATITQTGYVFLIFTVCAIPGAVLAARPTDRYDKRIAVSVAMAVVAGALAGLYFSPNVPIACVAAGFAGVGWGAFVTADWALAAAVLPPGEMATTMGIWNVATTIPQVIAPLATAPLVTRLNAVQPGLGPRAALALAFLEFVAGAAAVWRLPRA